MGNSNSDDDEKLREEWAEILRKIRRAWFKVFSDEEGVVAKDWHGHEVDRLQLSREDPSGADEWEPEDEDEDEDDWYEDDEE